MHGLNSTQMASLEAAKRGFVPGTLKAEVFNKTTGAWEQTKGVKSMLGSDDMMSVGGTYDPNTGSFVSNLGQSSAMGTKNAAQTLANTFNNMLGSTMSWEDTNAIRSNLEKDIFGNIKTGTKTFQEAYTDAAIKSAMDATGLSRSQLESVVSGGDFVVRGSGSGVNSRGYSTFSDFRGSSEEEDDAPASGSTPSTPSTPSTSTESRYSDVGDDSGGGGDDGGGQDGGHTDSGGDSVSESGMESGGGWGGDARGGIITHGRPQNRTNFAPGGEAGFAQRPEFVGGNQTQPDGVSVADDQPRDVQEGTFVINAAAADFAGRGDIEKMIRDAYKKAGDIGQSGVSQEVAINVSKGEVMIPPHIAKQIGYDKLNKINNRGKKEISRRQKTTQAASGGFISR